MSYSYSNNGLALTKSFEGLELNAYQDSVGVWTIGYGHTGPEVHEGLTWTQEQADDAVQSDTHDAARFVNGRVMYAISQNQFDALVDFAFNLGLGALGGSTLLKKVNSGDLAGAAQEFPLWDHAGGKVVEGLLRRRQAEQALFLA